MKKPRHPANEAKRIAHLRALKILDSAPESRFDNITALASSVFDCPVALISLVDEDRQWFKSRCGLETEQTDRDISLCGHVVEQGEPLIINDTREDELSQDNPLTLDDDKPVIFYAGAPLKLESGLVLGSLCVIDHKPRQFSQAQMDNLVRLATLVMDELELRAVIFQAQKTRAKLTAKTRQVEERNSKLLDLIDRFKGTRTRLIHAEKLATLGLLAAGISQEASQSINIVRKRLLDAQTMLSDTPDKKVLGLLSQGMESLDQVRRLMDGLCDTTETAQNHELTFTDLNETVKHARNVLLSRFDDKVRFVFSDTPDLPAVRAAESQIFIALLNVLMNAAESARSQVRVKVDLYCKGSFVVLRVIDNGEGIAADILERVTEPFFSHQRDSTHLGMGLAIAQGIMRDHGGGLRIRSQPGKGTQVLLALPIRTTTQVPDNDSELTPDLESDDEHALS